MTQHEYAQIQGIYNNNKAVTIYMYIYLPDRLSVCPSTPKPLRRYMLAVADFTVRSIRADSSTSACRLSQSELVSRQADVEESARIDRTEKSATANM